MSRTIFSEHYSIGKSERPRKAPIGHIGIVLYDGFSLLGVGTLVEALDFANELRASGMGRCLTYKVSLLSGVGGLVACSSSISVCTGRLDGQGSSTFDALYVAGGIGVTRALADNELIEVMGIAYAQGTAVRALGNGHALLTAASLSCDACTWPGPEGAKHDNPIDPRDERRDALLHLNLLLKRDLGKR